MKEKKDILKRFIGIPEYLVLEEFNNLSEEEKNNLNKEYTFLSNGEYITNVDLKVQRKNYRILAKMKRHIEGKLNDTYTSKPKQNYKEIFSIFDNSTKEDIINILSTLNEHDRSLIYKKYGENLNNLENKPNLTKEENLDINVRIVRDIKYRLKLLKKDYSIITYKDIFENIDLEELKTKAALLSNTQKARLYSIFGLTLEDKVFISNKRKESLLNSDIYNKIMKNNQTETKKEYKPFLECFSSERKKSETDEELLTRIKQAIKPEYMPKLIKKYGSNLNNQGVTITREENREIYKIILITKYYMKKNEKITNNYCKTLMSNFNPLTTYNEVLEFINKEDEKTLEILIKKYNSDFLGETLKNKLTKEENEIARKFIQKTEAKILRRQEKNSGINSTILRKIKLFTETKEYKYLKRKYGLHRAVAILMNIYFSDLTTNKIALLTNLDEKVVVYLTLKYLMEELSYYKEYFNETQKTLKLK